MDYNLRVGNNRKHFGRTGRVSKAKNEDGHQSSDCKLSFCRSGCVAY